MTNFKRLTQLAGAIIISLVFAAALPFGCATAPTPPAPWDQLTPNSNAIPNLSQVEPGVWRGGQPTAEGFAWLKTVGISNVIKLNADMEGSDLPAQDMGLQIRKFPILTLEQLVDGPDPAKMKAAVADIGPGTFIHCTHGEDRTGLLVGQYRLKEGWSKADAWREMKTNGFHQTLFGLSNYWADLPAQ